MHLGTTTFSFKTSKSEPSLLSLSGYGTDVNDYITYTSAECSLGNRRQVVYLMFGIVGHVQRDVTGIIRDNASGVCPLYQILRGRVSLPSPVLNGLGKITSIVTDHHCVR